MEVREFLERIREAGTLLWRIAAAPRPMRVQMAAPWSHFRPDLPVAMFVMPLERIHVRIG